MTKWKIKKLKEKVDTDKSKKKCYYVFSHVVDVFYFNAKETEKKRNSAERTTISALRTQANIVRHTQRLMVICVVGHKQAETLSTTTTKRKRMLYKQSAGIILWHIKQRKQGKKKRIVSKWTENKSKAKEEKKYRIASDGE